MGNQDPQVQSTDLESETISEEPPSFEEQLVVLDKVFDQSFDGIDAAVLLAEAEVDLSTFLLRVQCQTEQHQKTIGSYSVVVTPLERLDEIDLDFLSDEEILSNLQAEEIDCGLFLDDVYRQIETNTRMVF